MDPRSREPDRSQKTKDDGAAEKADQRLDEELEETFPASDPIPYRHDS